MLNIYETVYNLSADPFRLSPDHHFSYDHRSYARSKSFLDYALLQGEGFVMITGAPGTGKTTLIREILANIDITRIQVAMLTSTQLRSRDLLQMVATAFGLRFADGDKATLLTALEQFFQQQSKSGRRAVLIVDEAQGLPVSALEELRLLANLQRDNQMLLQVFLLGQEKLRELIRTPEMEQLRQRVVVSSHLEPLSLEDTVNYIQHRLNQAGWEGDPEIDGEALKLIHKYSEGVPRRINLICTRLLLSCGMKGKHVIDGQDGQEIILELQQEALLDPDDAEGQVNVADESQSPERSARIFGRKKEVPASDPPGQPSQPEEPSVPAADLSIRRSSAPKQADGSNMNTAPPGDAVPESDKKKEDIGKEQIYSTPVEREKSAIREVEMARPREVRVHIPPSSKSENEKIPRIGQKSGIRNRSISMATARAMPASEGQRVTSGAGSDERKPVEKTAKRKGNWLKMQFFIILLVVGPLAAVAGVNLRDYVITVAAQADGEGMIHRVMSDFRSMGDHDISSKATRGSGTAD